jgi:hypothetical protein
MECSFAVALIVLVAAAAVFGVFVEAQLFRNPSPGPR